MNFRLMTLARSVSKKDTFPVSGRNAVRIDGFVHFIILTLDEPLV